MLDPLLNHPCACCYHTVHFGFGPPTFAILATIPAIKLNSTGDPSLLPQKLDSLNLELFGILRMTSKAWPTWLKVPKVTKDLLWDNFKLRHYWEDLNDVQMKKVWKENASERFRSMIYLAKQKALEDAKEELNREVDTIDMVGRGPSWIMGQIWDELVEKYWNVKAYKKKCKVARKNRMIEKYGSITKHTAGSIPMGAHKLRMEKELKREVDCLEESYTQPTFDFQSWCEV